jgi:hypothetical protein
MSEFEVPEPILNSPYEEPREYWILEEGKAAEKGQGRRPSEYFYRPPSANGDSAAGTRIPLDLVNLVRERVKAWRHSPGDPWPGVSRTSRELLEYWQRDGRAQRLFFAQVEAAETVIFLAEARADFLQGIAVPLDEPSEDRKREGYAAFSRYACKMATGSGKTTVMAMLAAWSILNKTADRSNPRFSDTVLVVCPNVTIRSRLRELDPNEGEASVYRTRDLVPERLMPELRRGRVLVTNWHVFEPQTSQVGGASARVVKAGRPQVGREIIQIGTKTTSARGLRYMTPETLDAYLATGSMRVLHEERDETGALKRVEVESTKYVESDASVLNRVLGRAAGKQNILVMNDEAHHAYRIRRDAPDEREEDVHGEEEEAEEFYKEATVWVEVDTRVVHETDTGSAKSDDSAWMRFTLDTVGRREWPKDRQGRSLYPEAFEELAGKLDRPLHPPGRDVRCIVSVAMLTEGWDCNTVTHIIGLRPFMSQLLCEQVVGRGLRRTNYDVGEDGRLSEEVAKILGVPFEIVPFKANPKGPRAPRPKPNHVHALPERVSLEIRFPRVEGYRQAIRSRVKVDWSNMPRLVLNPRAIPPEIEMKAALPTNRGRHSLLGPGRIESVTLNPYREGRRQQQLVFELARDLTRGYAGRENGAAPAHVLFPQLVRIVERYLRDCVEPVPPAERLDVFLSPYYGWVIERLTEAIRPDDGDGGGELPRYETNRGPGSTAEVEFWTSRPVREVLRSHLNYVVADTKVWEQSAAYFIDTHARVFSFAKNAGLGLAIPYQHNGTPHDYLPDFVIRLKAEPERHVILETKGYDPLAEVKAQAAQRWADAVNADGRFGHWSFVMARRPEDVRGLLDKA